MPGLLGAVAVMWLTPAAAAALHVFGPAPSSAANMVADARTQIAAEQARLVQRQRKVTAASTTLDQAVAAMLAG